MNRIRNTDFRLRKGETIIAEGLLGSLILWVSDPNAHYISVSRNSVRVRFKTLIESYEWLRAYGDEEFDWKVVALE